MSKQRMKIRKSKVYKSKDLEALEFEQKIVGSYSRRQSPTDESKLTASLNAGYLSIHQSNGSNTSKQLEHPCCACCGDGRGLFVYCRLRLSSFVPFPSNSTAPGSSFSSSSSYPYSSSYLSGGGGILIGVSGGGCWTIDHSISPNPVTQLKSMRHHGFSYRLEIHHRHSALHLYEKDTIFVDTRADTSRNTGSCYHPTSVILTVRCQTASNGEFINCVETNPISFKFHRTRI